MCLKHDERLVRRKSITLPIGDFLRNNGMQLPQIWQRSQRVFVLSRSHPQNVNVAKKTSVGRLWLKSAHTRLGQWGDSRVLLNFGELLSGYTCSCGETGPIAQKTEPAR